MVISRSVRAMAAAIKTCKQSKTNSSKYCPLSPGLISCRAWCWTAVISAHRKWRQEDSCEFEASPVCISDFQVSQDCPVRFCLKQQQQQQRKPRKVKTADNMDPNPRPQSAALFFVWGYRVCRHPDTQKATSMALLAQLRLQVGAHMLAARSFSFK